MEKLELRHRDWVIPVVCIVAGTLIYITSRSGVLFMSWLGLSGHHVDVSGNKLLEWCIYSMPDGLWFFALLWIEYALKQRNSQLSRAVFIAAVIFPFMLELLQYFHVIPGTFDWIDIATYCLTILIFLLCKKERT